MRSGLAARARHLYMGLRPHVEDLLRNRFLVSFGVHGLVLFVALNAWWFGARKMKPAGTQHGVQLMMNTTFSAPAPFAAAKALPTVARRAVARHSMSMLVRESETDAAPAAEALGDGPATILFIQGFPTPLPQMPGGELTRDLIVDVEIDEHGRVMQTHKARGMGASVDDVIIATVQRWIFQPATKSGKAVSSAQELHFHFDARSNPGCGWACVQLMAN